MRHNNTKSMLNYWMELLEVRNGSIQEGVMPKWPERSDIQPASCRKMLGDMFILERESGEAQFRLAGTRLCAMFGRELKKTRFADNFSRFDQKSADSWSANLGRDGYLALICSSGRTASGQTANLETLIMPLTHNGQIDVRALGVTSVFDAPDWIGGVPIVEQTIRSVRIVRPWEENEFKSNWPFTSPEKLDLKEQREKVTSLPGLYARLPDHAEPASDNGRRVAHLRVIEGGKQD